MIYTFMSLPNGALIALWVLVALIVLGAAGSFLFLLYVAKRVFDGTLVREEGKWGYECSCPEDEEQMAMWNEGVQWYEDNKGVMREVDITSCDGLHLHGEFYDFGRKAAVIILPGRCECLRYSCYFAKPYAEMGVSVLCIDTRSHGQSDGKYSTIGKMEGEDVRSWVKFLSEEFGIESIWLHAICLGGAAAFYSAVGDNAPAAIKGIVAEGPYVTFRETYKQHLIQMKKPHFILVDLIMAHIKRKTGVDYRTVAPIKMCREYSGHILYIFGKQDQFSLPPKSRELYEETLSKTKKIVWLPKGGHSHLRVNNTKEYDAAIKEYLGEHV